MAKVSFKTLAGVSPELFPINIFDKIPQNHPVRLVNSVVDQLDLSKIIAMYKGGGCSAYHPHEPPALVRVHTNHLDDVPLGKLKLLSIVTNSH